MTTTAFPVRVWVSDVWDVVTLEVSPTWTIDDLKREALARATARSADLAEYQVKFRGALLTDEARTLEAVGAPAGGAFIVLPVRRRPVR